MTLDPERLKDMPSRPLEARPRQPIRDGTEVLGGILLTRTNIVVDTDENPEHYGAVVDEVDERLAVVEDPGTLDMLIAVEGAAALAMPYDSDDYRSLLKEEALAKGADRLGPEDYIGLSRFMFVGGICHQQALLEAATIRLLQERGDLGGGSVSVVSYDVTLDRHTKAVFREEGRSFTLVGGGLGVWPEGPPEGMLET